MSQQDEDTPTDSGPTVRLRGWFVFVVGLAAVPRLWTAGHYLTVDEPRWMFRSERFSDALLHGDLASASASLGEPATMPGGPTMWIGSLARLLWSMGRWVGLVDSRQFTGSDGTAMAQHVIAIVVSLLVGWLFVTVARWVGLVPALVVSLLVATGPWFVALGAVMHTDELAALFGTIGLVSLARALGLPDGDHREKNPRWVAASAGAALMLAPLTKVTGLGFLVGVPVMVLIAVIRDRRVGGKPWRPGSPLELSVIAAGAGVVMVPIMWPALVVDPAFQLERLGSAVGLAREEALAYSGSRQFYRGEPVDSPDWTYYLVAVALRVTPWYLAVLLVGIPASLARRSTRLHAVPLAVPAVAILIVITAVPKTFDRYALLVVVPLTVVAAIGIDDLRRRFRLDGALTRKAVVVSGAAMFVYSLSVAPWGLAHFNSALGGSHAGAETLLVGWGEGSELAEEWIDQKRKECRELDAPRESLPRENPCFAPTGGGRVPEFVPLYISTLQRDPSVRDEVEAEGRDLVMVIEIRGIPYVEIWR